jgi:WXXGXW repeat (2 copies)
VLHDGYFLVRAHDSGLYEVTQMHTFNIRRSLQTFRISRWVLLAAALLVIFVTSSTVSAQVVLSVAIAPPALPVYTQPVCPADGYIWTPGYWSYSDDGGYYWVPGTWVEAPEAGFLWTPGYWGWNNSAYVWNGGYWGPQVGFYGGVNYGFGYIGTGYAGGYWNGGHFFYNSRVNNVNARIVRNVYQKTVVEHRTYVSYNGGRGGITARPTAEQEAFAHERHTAPTAVQEQHESAARSDRNQFDSVNHGRPAVAATPKPGEFKGAGVVQAKASAPERATSTRTETRSAAKHETKTETKPRTETKPAATHETKAETKPRTETKPAATHETKAETKPRTETKPAATHETKTETKPRAETKPAATHETKTETKPRTETKPAATHETKTETKPQAESKPEATHESKPAEQHESAPREEKPPKE